MMVTFSNVETTHVKVLIVEDSERLRRSLRQGLGRAGFTVDVVGEGCAGLAYAQTNGYDAIVLDLMLPGLDGLTLLKRLREQGDITPILILSAKDQVEDRVRGLELGADDYLVKPFAFDELCVRIKALMRRRFNTKRPLLYLGVITLDVVKRQACTQDRALQLTRAEYGLLEYLALKRGQVLSKDQLHDVLHSSDSEAVSNVIEVLISALRKKLRDAGEADLIKTRRGYGYLIE